MPLIWSLLAWFAGSEARSFLVKSTYFAVYISVTIAAMAAFVAVIVTIAKGLYVAVPQPILNVWSWVAPSNLTECLIAIFSAKTARMLYDVRKEMMDKYLRTQT